MKLSWETPFNDRVKILGTKVFGSHQTENEDEGRVIWIFFHKQMRLGKEMSPRRFPTNLSSLIYTPSCKHSSL